MGRKIFRPASRKASTLGAIVRGFKIGVTKWFLNNAQIKTVWQHDYYDQVIRSEFDLKKIRDYIRNNPAQLKFFTGEQSFIYY